MGRFAFQYLGEKMEAFWKYASKKKIEKKSFDKNGPKRVKASRK